MELRQLRYFVQIVESGSLARASRQIYIAQPALSHQLAKLEHEIGGPLLHRSSRGVVPTPNGRALYEHAKFLLRHAEHAVYAAREGSPASGMVSVGLSPATACVLGLPLLLDLRAHHPGIVLNVVEGMSGHVYTMARAGQLDIAILFEENSALGMSVEPLVAEEVVLIIGADHPALPAGKKRISLEEVAALPLVMSSRQHRTRRYLEDEFARKGLRLSLVAEIDSVPLAMAAVRHGVGATIQARTTLLAEPSQEAFRVVRLTTRGLERKCYLYGPSAVNQFPAAQVVMTSVRAMTRRLVESGAWHGGTLIAGGPLPDAAAAEPVPAARRRKGQRAAKP